jgi:hypothetical protein
MPFLKTIRAFFGFCFVFFILLRPCSADSNVSLQAPKTRERYNLLLVVVNSLNKFRLPLYGNSNGVTPNINRFAQEAYVFKNLIAPISHTPPVIRELFRAAPHDRTFYTETDWRDQDIAKLSAYPLGKFLEQNEYVYLHEKMPTAEMPRPFVSFMHFWNLHFPYDLFRLRKERLPPDQRRIYKSRLRGIDDIRLVETPADTEKFPGFLDYQIFGVRRTEVPIGDEKVWNSLLQSLKEPGGSPAAFVAAGFPKKPTRRLAQVQTAAQLTFRDKTTIVKALNGLIRDPDSPVGKILFGPMTVYRSEGLFIGTHKFNRWDHSLVTDIEKHLFWPNPEPLLELRENGRLGLKTPLNRRNRMLLRQLYRQTLELLLPALAFHHPQHLWIALDPEDAKKWQISPDYEVELALFKSLYDANVSDVDRRFGESLEHLRKLGVLDETVVVFMGDHGEALMEHGRLEHGLTCFDEDISPPLAVRVPGRLARTTVVETQLRTADVLPTVIELMGLRPPAGPSPAGISLASALNGGPQPEITAYSRDYLSTRSIRRPDGWKLIWEMGTNRRELYHWKSDPGEKRDLSGENPQTAAELEEDLNRFLHGN